MPEIPTTPRDAENLTDEDLRVLARRHSSIVRRFLARREREAELRNLRLETLSQIRQSLATAAFFQPQTTQNPQTATAHYPAPQKEPDAGTSVSAEVPPKKIAEDSLPNSFPEESEFSKTWKKIGGAGLTASVLFHAALIIFAVFWVVSVYVKPPEAPPQFFATGSGGGRGGERPSYADVQSARRKSVKIKAGTQSRKIVSKVAKSALVLPDMPEMPTFPAYSGNAFAANGASSLGGDLSSGSGGGLGGGVGTGTGIGIGNARNFVSKFQTTQKILGTNVTASRLAVYMDSSGSMTEVLPIVREEILKKFPTADVYEFMGCSMGEISGVSRNRLETVSWKSKKKSLLRKYESEKKPSAARKSMRDLIRAARKAQRRGFSATYDTGAAWKKNLSSYGNALLSEWNGNDYNSWFALGRWLEMIFTEGGYDAVIVFADFQDYRDGQLEDESALFDRWLKLARENKQRVYFFTTEMLPQNIFRALAEHTGGEVAIPKSTAKNSETAKMTEEILKQFKRGVVPASSISQLSAPGKFVESEEEIPEEEFLELDDSEI